MNTSMKTSMNTSMKTNNKMKINKTDTKLPSLHVKGNSEIFKDFYAYYKNKSCMYSDKKSGFSVDISVPPPNVPPPPENKLPIDVLFGFLFFYDWDF